MGYNILNRYYRKQRKTFQMNLPMIEDRDKAEAIHDLRVSVKKIRSLFTLIRGITESGFHSKKRLKCFKKLFRSVACIRDMQVQQHFLAGIESSSQIKSTSFMEYLHGLEMEERKKLNGRIRNFKPIAWDLMDREILEIYHNTGKDQVISKTKQYVRDKIEKVHYLASQGKKKAFHETRRLLKEARYILDMLTLTMSDEKIEIQIEQIKIVEDLLGDWHDRQVALKLLKGFIRQGENKNDPPKADSMLKTLIKKDGKELLAQAVEKITAINATDI